MDEREAHIHHGFGAESNISPTPWKFTGKLRLNVKYPLILRGKINPTYSDRASRRGVTVEECWQMFAISITSVMRPRQCVRRQYSESTHNLFEIITFCMVDGIINFTHNLHIMRCYSLKTSIHLIICNIYDVHSDVRNLFIKKLKFVALYFCNKVFHDNCLCVLHTLHKINLRFHVFTKINNLFQFYMTILYENISYSLLVFYFVERNVQYWYNITNIESKCNIKL